jgi:hypothetical protein
LKILCALSPQVDLRITVIFQQDGEKVSGVFAFFVGGAVFHPATLRNNELDLQLDTPLANFSSTQR